MKGAKLILAYDDFFRDLEKVKNGKREEARGDYIKQLMRCSSLDVNWRSAWLQRFQRSKYSTKLRAQEISGDMSVVELRKLLTQILGSGVPTFIFDKRSEDVNDWVDAKSLCIKTSVKGFQTKSVVSTIKNHINPMWTSRHLIRLKDQIVRQRKTEAQIKESLETELMMHEEALQRQMGKVFRAEEECNDFLEFLLLLGRYGPLPDWLVFGFGQGGLAALPGRRYQRRLDRAALRIQNQWEKYWSYRFVQLTQAAKLLQRVFRGHQGRQSFLERCRILRRVEQCIFRIKFALIFKCFTSWQLYAKRSIRVKAMLRRSLRQALSMSFDLFAANAKTQKAQRFAKLRVFITKMYYKRALNIMESWSEWAHKMRRARAMTMRILSGIKYRIFEAWCSHTWMLRTCRKNIACSLLETAYQQVSKKVGLERLRNLASICIQRTVRGRAGRNAYRWKLDKAHLLERQNLRRKLFEREENQLQQRLNRLYLDQEETSKNDDNTVLEELVKQELAQLAKSLKAKKNHVLILRDIFYDEFMAWWFTNVESKEQMTTRLSTIKGKLQTATTWKKRKLDRIRGCVTVAESLQAVLMDGIRLGRTFMTCTTSLRNNIWWWTRQPILDLLLLWGKDSEKLRYLYSILVATNNWRANPSNETEAAATIIEWYTHEQSGDFEARPPSRVDTLFFHQNALRKSVTHPSWTWLLGFCMHQQGYNLLKQHIKAALDDKHWNMLCWQHIRVRAATRAAERAASINLQRVSRGFVAKRNTTGKRECIRMCVEDTLATKIRDMERARALKERRKCANAIATRLWDKAYKNGHLMAVIKRKKEIKATAASKISAAWRMFQAKDTLLRKLVERHDKIWNANHRNYFYLNTVSGEYSWSKPSLLAYCGAQDLPTPRSKLRDIRLPIYGRKEVQAAIRIQNFVRIRSAKNMAEYLKQTYHAQAQYAYHSGHAGYSYNSSSYSQEQQYGTYQGQHYYQQHQQHYYPQHQQYNTYQGQQHYPQPQQYNAYQGQQHYNRYQQHHGY